MLEPPENQGVLNIKVLEEQVSETKSIHEMHK